MKGLIIFLFLVCSTNAVSQQWQDRLVLSSLDLEFVELMLNQKELKFKQISKQGYKIILYDYDIEMHYDNTAIYFHTYFDYENIQINKINEFNNKHRWGRAYLSVGGALVFASEFDIDGGVTMDNLNISIDMALRVMELVPEFFN